METITLKADRREAIGKTKMKALRRAGRIPAVVYGQDINPLALAVDGKELNTVLHAKTGANALIHLEVPGAEKSDRTVMIKAVQFHPITDHVQHVDFQVISLTKKVRVKVQVHEVGESPAVRNGGILDHVHREIEVECLPMEIPSRIDVDISALDFGHSVHVKELRLPAGVQCTMDPEDVIFTVMAPREEEPAAETTAGEAVEPEVIRKGKEEKGEEGEAAALEKEKGAKAAPQAQKTPEAREKAGK